jgi:16S rRNA (cytidine1402-2'-O)-methyltransferase
VLFEAGNRAAATLADLEEALGDRPAALARELTKLHEEIARGTLSELRARFPGDLRGEVTLVVGTAPGRGATVEGEEAVEPVEEEIRRRLAAGEPPTGVARAVARSRDLSRPEAYALVERVRGRR